MVIFNETCGSWRRSRWLNIGRCEVFPDGGRRRTTRHDMTCRCCRRDACDDRHRPRYRRRHQAMSAVVSGIWRIAMHQLTCQQQAIAPGRRQCWAGYAQTTLSGLRSRRRLKACAARSLPRQYRRWRLPVIAMRIRWQRRAAKAADILPEAEQPGMLASACCGAFSHGSISR